ncbi:MAG: hypothetical protein AAF791_03580 [Bacteroidota bacterium]
MSSATSRRSLRLGPEAGRLRLAAVLPLLLAGAMVLSGCYSFEMARVSKRVGQDIERQTGADVGGGLSMGLGPISLATAQAGAWVFAPESTREARQIGRHIASVEFSRRPVRGFDGRLVERPAYLERYTRSGWHPFVSVRDSASAVFVFLRERGREQRITNLLAVVVAEDELMLTKVSGNLSAMIREAIAVGGSDLLGGDLFGDALEDAGLIESDDEVPLPDVETAP